MKFPLLTGLAVALLFRAPAAWAQTPQAPPSTPPPLFKGDKKGKEDPMARTVEGTVKDEQDNPIEGAVVKLKDLKSLNVRSFITKSDGKFFFAGLRRDIDYQLKADHLKLSSPTKTVSVFDSRKQVVLNLKVEPVKPEEK